MASAIDSGKGVGSVLSPPYSISTPWRAIARVSGSKIGPPTITRSRSSRLSASVATTCAAPASLSAALLARLRVTAPVHFGRCCVMPILMRLVESFPDLKPELSLTDRFADPAEENIDLAIRTGNVGNQAGCIGRRIARQCMVVCGAPDYLAAHGTPQSIEDLAQHRAVVYRGSGIAAPWKFPSGTGLPTEITPWAAAYIDDLAAIADAVTTGVGLAWLPSWLIAKRLASGSLVELLPAQSGFP